MRVDDSGRVGRARTEVEVREYLVIALLSLELCHLACLVVDVAKRDRAGRARLLARRYNLAIANLTVFLIGGNLRRFNALHAVAALLHHPARTYRNIRIARELQALGV